LSVNCILCEACASVPAVALPPFGTARPPSKGSAAQSNLGFMYRKGQGVGAHEADVGNENGNCWNEGGRQSSMLGRIERIPDGEQAITPRGNCQSCPLWRGRSYACSLRRERRGHDPHVVAIDCHRNPVMHRYCQPLGRGPGHSVWSLITRRPCRICEHQGTPSWGTVFDRVSTGRHRLAIRTLATPSGDDDDGGGAVLKRGRAGGEVANSSGVRVESGIGGDG